MTTTTKAEPNSVGLDVPRTVELELTGRCQLACGHCLSDSGPTAPHGTMGQGDWMAVIAECAELGVETVQLIGGEPTVFAGWENLVDYALGFKLKVEVFTNLYKIADQAWDVLSQPGVSLGTSYYSVNPDEHDRVTGKPGSHKRTRDNIIRALHRNIPIRAGVVRVNDGQLAELAVEELEALGVGRVTLDNTRLVGRAAGGAEPTVDTLCGRCALGKVAILPDGTVSPCVLGRFLPTGNVTEAGLRDVLTSTKWAETAAGIPRKATAGCPPNDSNDCNPANTEACAPAYFAPIARRGMCVPKVTVSGPVPVDIGGCPPTDSEACDPKH
ncbi:radical SAM protein [Kitasatospora sp. NPDC056531]|uniref:radical SAM protein n=1 Tax=Kitasatospora sp. NPDC056531 TaxID=3345856 RepID=UPI0036AF6EDA